MTRAFHDRAPLMMRLTALASISIVAAVGAPSVASVWPKH
jgi:hypothetical protein